MWIPVTVGMSGATVERRGDVYRKRSADPRHDLVSEAERLTWLRSHGLPAVEVLDSRRIRRGSPSTGCSTSSARDGRRGCR
ncbi:hypothetical protein ACFQX7_02720 [Luedemannella flava]